MEGDKAFVEVRASAPTDDFIRQFMQQQMQLLASSQDRSVSEVFHELKQRIDAGEVSMQQRQTIYPLVREAGAWKIALSELDEDPLEEECAQLLYKYLDKLQEDIDRLVAETKAHFDIHEDKSAATKPAQLPADNPHNRKQTTP